MDPVTLATLAVTALSPYLIEAAKGAGGKAGEAAYEGVGKLFRFLKDKLSGSDEQKALRRVEEHPEDADNQAALRVVLKETLQRDQGFCGELEALLKSLPKTAPSQSANVMGNENVVTQAAGSGISINVDRK